MKNTLFLSLLLSLSHSSLHAQTPDWLGQFSTEAGVSLADMAMDADGNIYTCGGFGGTVDLDPGSGVFEATGGSFLCKMDSNGDLVWAKAFESNAVSAIDVDDLGAVYLGFNLFNTADFDPGEGVLNFTAQGFGDIVLVKLLPNGDFDWALQLGGQGSENVYGLHCANDGSLFATGTFQQTVDFDPSGESAELSSNGGTDSFALKLTSEGEFVWAKAFGGSGFDYGDHVLSDAAGNVIVQGGFTGVVDFDPNQGVTELDSGEGSDVFLCKLSASGEFLWAGNIGGEASMTPTSMALDGSNHVYLCGTYSGTTDLDPTVELLPFESQGQTSSYICKISSEDGSLVWAKSFDSTMRTIVSDLAVDQDGHVFSVGYFGGTADFDPGSGEVLIIGNDNFDFDAFFSRLDNDGNYLCAVAIITPHSQYPTRIELTESGRQVVAGSFEGTVDFDPGPGVSELIQVGEPIVLSDIESDVFIMQLQLDECLEVNIEEQASENQIRLFPNPTSGILSIDLGEMRSELEVRLMDVTGQLISTEIYQNTNFVSLELNTAPGVYFLEVLSKEHRTVVRVIRE